MHHAIYLSFSFSFRRSNSHFCCWINFLICEHWYVGIYTARIRQKQNACTQHRTHFISNHTHTTLIEYCQTHICRYAFIIFERQFLSLPLLKILHMMLVECEYFTSKTAKSSKNDQQKFFFKKKITYEWSAQNKIEIKHENEWQDMGSKKSITARW